MYFNNQIPITRQKIAFAILSISLSIVCCWAIFYKGEFYDWLSVLFLPYWLFIMTYLLRPYFHKQYFGWGKSHINYRNGGKVTSIHVGKVLKATHRRSFILFDQRYQEQPFLDLEGVSSKDVARIKQILTELLGERADWEGKPLLNNYLKQIDDP